ncbi:MAG TPA: bifunctional riboflavin kinase/FAD synthetase [Steroidobacteraceae bacterium]|nr:bifunctional riboflavin kinase/FAD synthetase [Steroidobacteraceae bacterium]
MELVRGLHNLRAEHRGCAVTIGNFDGVHLGHRATLERLREHARLIGQPATVLTFEPTPREFLSPARAPARLTRLREKLVLLARERLDRCVVLRFDSHLQHVRAQEFIERLLVARLDARRIVVGHDFRFGYRGEADVAVLQAAAPKHGFEVEVIEPLMLDGVRVSSSAVREALASGDLGRAARLLGRPYSMQGRVMAGDRLGHKLGYPTANLRLHRRLAPLGGIFAVRVHGVRAEPLPGVASLGTRPTVNGTEPLLEAHIFDFAGDLYRRHLEVEFVQRLREERKFATLEAMVVQMHEDARRAREALQKVDS